jgi:hypothetical protein
VIALAEDEFDDVEFMTFGFRDLRDDVTDFLPDGTVFEVKEPALEWVCDNHWAVIVNSPSDVSWPSPTTADAGLGVKPRPVTARRGSPAATLPCNRHGTSRRCGRMIAQWNSNRRIGKSIPTAHWL